MILIYLACFLGFLYYLYTRNYNYWESRGVPFEKPFSIFGNFYNIVTRKQHISGLIKDLYNKFDTPYFGIYIFNQPTFVVRKPEIVKKILVKDFDKFVNRKFASNEAVDPIAAHTLFSAQDQVWKGLRSKISPVFTSGKMKMMVSLIQECGSDLSNHLAKSSGQVVDVVDAMKRFTVDVISTCAFGINSHCFKDKDSEMFKVARTLLDPKSLLRNFSMLSFFFAPKFVDIFRLTFVDKASSDYLTSVFNTTIKEREKKNIVRHDLIDLLNNLKKNEKFSDEYIFDDIKLASQAIVFFSAGNDTTALTVSFGLYELAIKPEIQSRLREEIRKNIEKHGGFTYEGIHEMKYLDMVFNEILRKYPLTTFLNRKASDKYTFEETGFTLDKDVSVLIPIAGLHYDPEFFPDPEKFDPERFSDENKNNIVPYTYLPFGDGPRNCIGQRFAVLVSKIALAYCLKDFAFERTKETPVPLEIDPGSIFMYSKGDFNLRVNKI